MALDQGANADRQAHLAPAGSARPGVAHAELVLTERRIDLSRGLLVGTTEDQGCSDHPSGHRPVRGRRVYARRGSEARVLTRRRASSAADRVKTTT